VIVLDAYALVAHLRDESAAPAVRTMLREGGCVMSAVNLTEVLDHLARVRRVDDRRLRSAMSGLLGGLVEVLPVDESIAWRAASIRARHYHRSERDLSLADCILIASAGPEDTIATADAHVATTARSEGIDVRKLPGGV
jgi:PIN domain nuclease of toxin-antitoxin system